MKKLLSIAAFAVVVFSGQAAQAQPSPVPSGSPLGEPPMNPAVTASPMMATPMASPMMATPMASPMMASPAPAGPVAPSPSPSASTPPHLIQFSGFGDAAYSSRAGDTSTRFSNGFPSRVFDYGTGYLNTKSALQLQNLNVQAALNAGNLTGKLELSSGTDADLIQSYPGAFNGFDVTQAYLSYALGKASVQAGKFETLAGAEVIESPSNLNFSRSILFGYAVPFTHTGGRVTYAVTPHLNVIGGVNAGWDEIRSTNGRLTAEYAFAFNPSSAVSLTAQGYTGFEQISNYTVGFNPLGQSVDSNNQPVPVNIVPSGAQGQRSLIDVVGTVHPTSATTFTLNYDRGLQHNAGLGDVDGANTAGWSGLAGYASYQVNPRVVASVRYEGFHDTDGYRTGFVQFWREGTATVGYSLTPAVTLRGEYRHDVSDQSVFLRTDGSTANNNSTFGLEGLVKF